MNALKKVSVCLMATALVFALAAALNPQKARVVAATFVNVFVANDSAHPVPVTGNVGITGTQTVQLTPGSSVDINGVPAVQVTGTPTVQLAPGATVGVTGGTFNFSNTPSTPVFTRDKDNPALSPFTIELCKGFTNIGFFPCNSPESITVDVNKRLVIEFVAVRCVQADASGIVTEFNLRTTAGGTDSVYVLPINTTSFLSGTRISHFNQLVRLYADPGSKITLFIDFALAPPGGVVCDARLSGNSVTP